MGEILIAVTDGLKGLAEAPGAVFPATTAAETCAVHLIRNSLNHETESCWPRPFVRSIRPPAPRRHWPSSIPLRLGLGERNSPSVVAAWRQAWDPAVLGRCCGRRRWCECGPHLGTQATRRWPGCAEVQYRAQTGENRVLGRGLYLQGPEAHDPDDLAAGQDHHGQWSGRAPRLRMLGAATAAVFVGSSRTVPARLAKMR